MGPITYDQAKSVFTAVLKCNVTPLLCIQNGIGDVTPMTDVAHPDTPQMYQLQFANGTFVDCGLLLARILSESSQLARLRELIENLSSASSFSPYGYLLAWLQNSGVVLPEVL